MLCLFHCTWIIFIPNPNQSINRRKRDNILRNHLKNLRLDSCGLLYCPAVPPYWIIRIMAQNKVYVMSRVSRHKVSRGMVKKVKKIERRKEKEKYKKSGKKKRKRKRKHCCLCIPPYQFQYLISMSSSARDIKLPDLSVLNYSFFQKEANFVPVLGP